MSGRGSSKQKGEIQKAGQDMNEKNGGAFPRHFSAIDLEYTPIPLRWR